jgi:hypothetical protein
VSGGEQQASDENSGEIGGNRAMKRECDISIKHSKISDEGFSGVCSTLKAVTDWMQLYTKKSV